MKTALVTGAAGFIGGAAARRFVEADWHVLALLHRADAPELATMAAQGRVTFLRGDAADASSFRPALDGALARLGARLDVVVHAAGRASDVGPAALFRRSHVASAEALARLVLATGARRLVLVSTTDVYGLRDFHGEGEDALPLRAWPANPYPVCKIEAEAAVRRLLPPERRAIVRPAAVWGPGDRTLTPRVAAFLRRSPWIVHFGRWRGRNRWPLAHVRNVVSVLYVAAVTPRAGLEVHVLDAERTSVDAFYRMVAAAYAPGKRFRTLCLPFWAGRLFGGVASGVTALLGRDRPVLEPTAYAVHSVSRNLDWSDARWRGLLEEHGLQPVAREAALREWGGTGGTERR